LTKSIEDRKGPYSFIKKKQIMLEIKYKYERKCNEIGSITSVQVKHLRIRNSNDLTKAYVQA
jgi:hypothetical protein